MDALVAETGADELIIVSDVYDHPTRLRSLELIARKVAPSPDAFSLLIDGDNRSLSDECRRHQNRFRHSSVVEKMAFDRKRSTQLTRLKGYGRLPTSEEGTWRRRLGTEMLALLFSRFGQQTTQFVDLLGHVDRACFQHIDGMAAMAFGLQFGNALVEDV